MVLKELTSEQYNKIESFVTNHPNGNFFQSPAAYKLFQSAENHQPFVIIASENEELKGILTGVIFNEPGIKGFFSRRCIVWGGPIVNSDELAGLLIDELNNFVKSRAIYTEFRNLFDLSSVDDQFKKRGYEFEDRINYIVELESIEANTIKLNENRRRRIKKSIKSGAAIVNPNEISEVKEFYSILKKLYKEKVKKPLPSFDFFARFFEQKELGKYLFVKYEGKIIGGIMAPVFMDTIYEWYICGLDNEFKDQSPSVMATWAAIEYGINNGLKYFDFMGAGKPDDEYGVREFKSKFGGKEVRYGRYLRINNKLLYSLGKFGLKILSKIK